MFIWSLLSAAGLALIHLFNHHLRFLDKMPRSAWLSAAGGISVAYVFLHLLPELAEGQEVLREQMPPAIRVIEHHIYLVAFTGLALFYGLERAAVGSRAEHRGHRGQDVPAPGMFWLHVASFSLYNFLIGYLLTGPRRSAQELGFFFVAMALHFLVTDSGLREHYKHLYTRFGRWVLAVAVLAGWAAGEAFDLPEAAVRILIALLAGGVILNVLKEELPEERKSRFSAFLIGGAFYAALLVAF